MKPEQNSILQSHHRRRAMPASWDVECHRIFLLDTQERIEAIKRGVAPEVLGRLSAQMAVPKQWLIGILGLSRATISRKERQHTPLSVDESERVLGVQALIGQLEDMIMESGEPERFDPAKWFGAWLDRYVPALGRKPAWYMDTVEGQKLIEDLLGASQSGAYW